MSGKITAKAAINTLRDYLQKQVDVFTGFRGDSVSSLTNEEVYVFSGYAEYGDERKDVWGNKDFQHNPLFYQGKLFSPALNEHILEDCRKKGMEISPFPNGSGFAACLTHDVDLMQSVPSVMSKKKIRKHLSNIKHGIKPVDYYEWLKMEGSYGYRSTFFVLPEKVINRHPYDGDYKYSDVTLFNGRKCTVSGMLKEMSAQGWETGVHGSYLSFDNHEELLFAKQQLESATGSEAVSVRQHFLHFNIGVTPRHQQKAGFKFDSTFGFNRSVGFRNGAGFPVQYYDYENNKNMSLLSVPLTVQDVALFRGDCLSLDIPSGVKLCKSIIDSVKKNKGAITFLWHFHVLSNARECEGWMDAYREILDYLSANKAWVCTVAQLGEYWNSRRATLKP